MTPYKNRKHRKNGRTCDYELGFVSAILDGWTFEGMVDAAAEMGYQCVEVACWPAGKAERRYAGVSHIDVDALDDEKVRYIHGYLEQRGVEISPWRTTPTPSTATWKSAPPP